MQGHHSLAMYSKRMIADDHTLGVPSQERLTMPNIMGASNHIAPIDVGHRQNTKLLGASRFSNLVSVSVENEKISFSTETKFDPINGEESGWGETPVRSF